MPNLYAGHEWVERCFKIELSPLGKAAADLMGDVWLGIYHLNHGALRRTNWDNPDWIEHIVYGGLATYDDDLLTRLVVLGHDRLLRVSIEAASWRHLRLIITARKTRDGEYYERMPTLETHTANLRAHYAQLSLPGMEASK